MPGQREAPAPDATPVVFVVDDDDAVRDALTRLIAIAGHRVMAFRSASEFLDHRYDGRTPACLVLDVRMPDVGGLDLQRALKAASAPLPIIFITGHGDVATTVQAMKAGANDFLTKPVEDAALLHAVDQALCHAAHTLERRAQQEVIRHRLDQLTPREREVLALLMQGRLNKQAAYELGITEKTIKVHRAHVMEKMRVHSLVELARAADRAGIALPSAVERP